jgi:UDP:flavonoid glycosyltransferase YjiC (YdhE family)
MLVLGYKMIVRKRVLFFAEPATLAHVVRPIVLASGLDPKYYDVSVATGPDFRHLAEESGLQVRDIWCIGARAYLAAVAASRVVFPYRVLERYVDDDLRVIEEARPDVIVGDFRLSLAVSARLAEIPYLAISNAYWSPFAPVRFEIPTHIFTRLLGVSIANRLFALLRPLIFAQHSFPMYRLRRKYGMSSLGFDLSRVFTEADVTLFADVPEMVPNIDSGMPGRYRYIGPIAWAPKGKIPPALKDESDLRPLVYVSLGSSGDPALLGDIVAAVISLGCRAAVSSAGGTWSAPFGNDVVIDQMLPGGEIAALAKLVICNGGSPSVHQALLHGTPVLGIPANLDQLLNMQFVVKAGAGLSVRADSVSQRLILEAAQRILGDPLFLQGAKRVEGWFSTYSAIERFATIISQVTGQPCV